MTMTVGRLMKMLESIDPATEVRFASQPSWPFEYGIEGVYVVDMLGDDDEYATLEPGEEDDYDSDAEQMENEPSFNEGGKIIVYLTESSQIGYLPGIVAQTIGWR